VAEQLQLEALSERLMSMMKTVSEAMSESRHAANTRLMNDRQLLAKGTHHSRDSRSYFTATGSTMTAVP
jgi:hypothetical protein